MSGRYTRFHSSYILRKKHQSTNLGTIYERDWPTTNGLNVLRFGAGRRIWYNSGSFVFTTSNIPTYHKKHKLTTETKEWTWDDCKDADGTTNKVQPNFITNDIRDYAYYGSCVELIRATIEEIIADFPGRIIVSNRTAEGYNIDGYIMTNDFNIDLHHKSVTLGKYDNEMRFMSNSWRKYCIKTKVDGVTYEENITKFEISEWLGDLKCPKNDEGANVVNIRFTTERVNDACAYDEDNKLTVQNYIVRGYKLNGNIYYVYYQGDKDNKGTYNAPPSISIQPQQEYIDEYFLGLTGFKAQLLRQDTKPYYSNKFKTPIEYNFTWFYPERFYIWPSDDYCIDISSIAFTTFCDKLGNMGQIFDELWSDNIYRSMTHEAIKNFDWTYSREYYEGDEQDNIDGGERMQKILRVFGRVFDDIKYYIDNIQLIPNTTYDKIKNAPEALLSDAVALSGIDATTTIGSDYDINETITSDFLKNYVTKNVSWCAEPYQSMHKKWYQNRNSEDVYPDICDNELMRRFTISTKRLMQTKGTQHAIEMIMGFFGFGRDVDYEIEEEAFYTKKLIPYNECINGDGKDTEKDWTSNTEYPVDWANISSTIKGEVAIEANNAKQNELLYYEDVFSGVPLRTVLLGKQNMPYIVPYYDGDVLYDGNLIFQSKGGWGKFIKDNDTDLLDDCFDYQETLSYLHVVGNIGEMLSINGNSLQKYDIYYVVNLNDYTDYDQFPPVEENGSMTVSHYFVCMDDSQPDQFSSWKNIVIKSSSKDGETEMVDKNTFEDFFGDNSCANWYYNIDSLKKIREENGITDEPTEDEQKSTYEYCFKHLKYLEGIFSTNVGNNPHVGYGYYDDGKSFLEYMEKPFKWSIENANFSDLNYKNIAQMVTFNDILEKDEKSGEYTHRVTDKIQVMGITKDSYNNKIYHWNKKDDVNDVEKIWYINTKVLTITNKVDSNFTLIADTLYTKEYGSITNNEELNSEISKGHTLYKDSNLLYKAVLNVDYKNMYLNYLKGVILPYLMQVIPSTTILKLKGFN